MLPEVLPDTRYVLHHGNADSWDNDVILHGILLSLSLRHEAFKDTYNDGL